MPMHLDCLVVGAGVSGLTTAVCLAEAGLAVQVRTRAPPGETTSCAAGAIWGPYLVDDHRVAGWSEITRSTLDGLADQGYTGIRLAYGLEASRAPTAPPGWAVELAGYQDCQPGELPDGFASGWCYWVPVLDMPVYLDYLVERLRQAAGELAVQPVGSLAEALAVAPVAVNCTGLGARDLVPDRTVTSTRGQVVVVDNPGIDTFFVEHDDSPEPTYFLPQGDHLVLGGSAEPGRTDLAPDPRVAAAIRDRCIRVAPSIAAATVREDRVGLRPTRSPVRVECTRVGRRHVIHNYGHGGAGVTLSWGCAREVLGLVGQL